MQIKITTQVEASLARVWEGLDERLFLALNPPLMPVKLLRFDGCEAGDEVHVLLPGKQLWISRIIKSNKSEKDILFVDVGIKLPFFLKKWRHRHIFRKLETGGSEIVDEIFYESPNKLLDILFFPVFYCQFWYRKPIYRRFFGKKSK